MDGGMAKTCLEEGYVDRELVEESKSCVNPMRDLDRHLVLRSAFASTSRPGK